MKPLLTADLGCGSVNDLRFDYRIDIKKSDATTHVANMLDLSFISDSSLALIKCAHAFDHLTPEEQAIALKEWHRVLAPHGVVHIVVVDADWVPYARERKYITDEWANKLLQGGEVDAWDVHKGLHGARSLEALFASCGFRLASLHDGNEAAGSLDVIFERVEE